MVSCMHMTLHILSKIRVAETLDGWQVWFEGCPEPVALTDNAQEAEAIAAKIRRIGRGLDFSNRLRSSMFGA